MPLAVAVRSIRTSGGATLRRAGVRLGRRVRSARMPVMPPAARSRGEGREGVLASNGSADDRYQVAFELSTVRRDRFFGMHPKVSTRSLPSMSWTTLGSPPSMHMDSVHMDSVPDPCARRLACGKVAMRDHRVGVGFPAGRLLLTF